MDVRELSELIHGIKLSMWGKSGLSSELARNMYLAESLIAHGVTVQGEIDANTYQLMRECERLKKQNESFANAVNVLEEINSDLCKQIKGVTVQEWISVKDERKPKQLQECLCVCQFDDDAKGERRFFNVLKWHDVPYQDNGIVNRPHFTDEGVHGMVVTHWMPLLKMPQPPKGE